MQHRCTSILRPLNRDNLVRYVIIIGLLIGGVVYNRVVNRGCGFMMLVIH